MNNFSFKAMFVLFLVTLFTGFVSAGGSPSGHITLTDANLGHQIVMTEDVNIADYNGYYKYEGSLGDTNYIDINCNGYDIYDFSESSGIYFFGSTQGSDLNRLIFRDCNVIINGGETTFIMPDANLVYIEVYDSNFEFGATNLFFSQAGSNNLLDFYFENINGNIVLDDLNSNTVNIYGDLPQKNNLSFDFYTSEISDLVIHDLNVDSDTNLLSFSTTNITNLEMYNNDLNIASFADVSLDSYIYGGEIYNNRIWYTSFLLDTIVYSEEDNFLADFNTTLDENATLRQVWFDDDSNYIGGNYFVDQGINRCSGDEDGLNGICDVFFVMFNFTNDDLPLIEYNTPTIDLSAEDISFSDIDKTINLGASITITVDYNNLGTGDTNEDYNIIYTVNGTEIENYLVSSTLTAGDSDSNSKAWTSNVGGDDVNIGVCLVYSGTDANASNDCIYDTIHVKAPDMKVTSSGLTLNDTSVTESTSVTATLAYTNDGDLAATSSYSVQFYRKKSSESDSSYVEICSSSKTVTADLAIDDDATKTCTFTAPSVSASTTYVIKATVTYTGDSLSSNNSDTISLSVANSTSATGSSGSSGSDSGIDLKAMSLTYNDVNLGQDVSFKFIFKNIGDEDATANYTAKILVTQSSKTIKTLSQTYSENLDSGSQKTYTATWKPTFAGTYTVKATIDYSGDDDSASNDSLTKTLTVKDGNAKIVIAPVLNVPTTGGTKVLGTNRIMQTAGDYNSLIRNLIEAVADVPEIKLPSQADSNKIYLPVEVTRIFKCYSDVNDANTQKCLVTLSLHNVGDKNLVNYKYIEILPDLNGNVRSIVFDLNLGSQKYVVLKYTVAASSIDAKDQAKFYGLVTSDPASVTIPKSKSFSMPWKTIGLVVLIIIGAGIVVLLIYYLIKLIRNTRSGFRYYRNHESRGEETSPKWKGIGQENSGAKYKQGKYKVKEFKPSGPKYKGWN